MLTERDLLKTDGKRLINQDGKEVVLRGTNLGGWLHREGWMDGGGACLAPLPLARSVKNDKGFEFEFPEVLRCNRIQVAGDMTGTFRILTSLDGGNWREAASGNFTDSGSSALDHMRPAPYMPDVNVYDEGCFVQGDLIHTNEFFTRYLRVEAESIERVVPLRYGDIDEFHGRDVLCRRFGEEKAEELIAVYQDCYIREEDLDEIRALGFNFVRVPIYWQEIMDPDGRIKENAWENLDWVLEQCRARDLYVMLDYHAAPGGNTMGMITAGQLDSNDFWTKEEYQRMSLEILKAMAGRYLGRPEIAAYDLLNEPGAIEPAYMERDMTGIELPAAPTLFYHVPERLSGPVRRFYRRAYEAVRGVGDEHILCMQQFADLELVEQPQIYGWENVMYQVHCYPVGNWRSHADVAASMKAYQETLKKTFDQWTVPAFVGEFCCWEFMDVWEEWLSFLNAQGVCWANWSYKITDPVQKDNWSLYYDFDGTYVDYIYDNAQTIRLKWSQYGTGHYQRNVELAEMLSRYAKA